MLQKAEAERFIHGMKIAPTGPSITHLLFADDSLFFCRSTSYDCKNIALILKQYEEASGQMVNKDKSSVVFGFKIPENRRRLLHRLLGIANVGGAGKYLGLPEQFGRKKTEMFQYIVQRVKARTKNWSTRYLSPAGREILIKSIAMALPVYSMNCFLLPLAICDEINSVLSKFWWGTNNGRRKLSWIAWNKMSVSKKQGGLGFRDLHNFNRALLGKQAWRLLTNPTSLLARLYKARYHPNSSYLQADNGLYASFGWKSIQVGKELLRQGLRVRLGDGTNTKIWDDPWLPTIPPRPAYGPVLDPNMTVADLWVANKREWNVDMFEGVLNPVDQQLASSLYLSKYASVDSYEWAYTENADYSVKSGYWVATQVNEEHNLESPPGDLNLKKEIWRLKIAPKIQHFLWRLLTGSIASAVQLNTRSIPVDPICQRCCQDDETLNHLIFTCPYAIAVWRCANIHIGSGNAPSNLLEDNLRYVFDYSKRQQLSLSNRLHPFWLMWRIWKSRNEYLFQKKNRNPVSDAKKSLDEVLEWLEANPGSIHVDTVHRSSIIKDKRWIPPPVGWVKCNFDSTYIRDREYTGSGWILRDHNGQFLRGSSAKLQASKSPLQAEAFGFLHALQSMWTTGFRHIWFESDNQELVNLINKSGEHLLLGNLLYDTRCWMEKHPESSLDFVNRGKNSAADMLSRYASTLNSLSCNFSSPPYWLVEYLYEPYTI